MTSKPANTPTSGAFYVQAVLSFGLSMTAVGIGVVFLPVDGWVRAFLGIAMLYTVTSAFTLAKVIRDRQEDTYISSRVDRARLDKLLAEHDPFKLDAA
ncbi:YiaA/YiaB family inner membrane protein [Lentzea sp. NPDC059081]|uniref:YiaA/YiaB family inner membrane protein n=1 Tax=Lentzea sp. NPDC059081 TaxID=3346719 RepID=UPI003697F683